MLVARIDKDGYFVEDVILKTGEQIPEDCITERPDTTIKGFYKARWTGSGWVEGMPEQKLAELRASSERQNQITQLESLLAERYAAHGRLLATDADPAEIEEVKGEIALILGELEGLYRA